jgi:hypothetical protein
MDEDASLRRHNSQSNNQTTQRPTKKIAFCRFRKREVIRSEQKMQQWLQRAQASKYDESVYVERWLNILEELQAKISPTQTASCIQNQKPTV